MDVVVTSPPYWNKRDYGFKNQIGCESTPEKYVENLLAVMSEIRRVMKKSGSLFLNVGDTYYRKSLVGIPGLIESAATKQKWILRNRIIWVKDGGMPEPSRNRLANRHEYILHFVKSPNYYYDLIGYSEEFGNGANPGDVWRIPLGRNMGGHLAPFPEELVKRALLLSCPKEICPKCGFIRHRIFERTAQLDLNRPQAKRAMEIARERGLTPEHIRAIQATGISDAGKALRVQNGTGRNTKRVQELAKAAKKALGGYFREFTFAKRKTTGWTACSCKAGFAPGVVLDPFMGTQTTLKVAKSLGVNSIGIDLAPKSDKDVWG
ncbi:MAG TPA: site-specific DNA-methyltransferase [Gammaproteobacteria bacterium]